MKRNRSYRLRVELPGDQLELFTMADREPCQPNLRAEELVALDGAARFLVGIAEGRVAMSPENANGLHEALAVVATRDPGGRLGHVVRRFLAQPPNPSRWAELVEELAFVLRLATGVADE